MLTFLTGLDAGAKRACIIQEAAAFAAAGRQVYLIVPDQVSFERQRELLFALGERTANQIRVSGFVHFSETLLREAGEPVRPQADEAAEAVLMSLALRDLGDELEIYRRHARSPGSVQSLLSVYRAVEAAGADAQALERAGAAADSESLRRKTRELARVFTCYEALLTPRFSTAGRNLRRAANVLAAGGACAGAVFFFDDFRGFTGLQLRFIAGLTGRADVYVSLPACGPGEGPEFAHVTRNGARLKAAARAAGARIRVQPVPSAEDTPMQALRGRLFAAARPETENSFADTVSFTRAGDKYLECEDIAAQIRDLLKSGACRASEIAAFVRDDITRGALIAALERAGVPVFDDRRRPLAAFPPARLLTCAAAAAAKGFDTAAVLGLLKTGIAGLTEEESAALENYVYRWELTGAAWTREFTANPAGFGEPMNAANRRALDELNALRRRVAEPLDRLRAAMKQGTAAACCRAAYDYMIGVGADACFLEYARRLYDAGDETGALECGRAWDACMEALDALAAAAGEKPVGAEGFCELLQIQLAGADLGEIPAGLDQVRVGDAARARYLSPKAVFLPGFTAEAYPRADSGQRVLTAEDLKRLAERELDLEVSPEAVFEEEKLVAWQALTCAAREVHVSYPAATVTGEKNEPSVFLADLEAAAPGLTRRFADGAFDPSGICSPSAALAALALAIGEKRPEEASLKAALEAAGQGERAEALYRAAKGPEAGFDDPAEAVRLFGRDLGFSASRSEAYATCPFRFFCRYGMQAEPVSPAKIDVRINGLLVHAVLENLLAEDPDAALSRCTEPELRARVAAEVTAYAEENLGGRAGLPPALERMLRRAENTIFEILLRLRSEALSCSFRPFRTELKIGGAGAEVPCYEVPLPSGGTLRIYGSVDRADVMETDSGTWVRVVDYKTQGKEFRLCDVFDGLSMQMLLYLFALCDNGRELLREPAPAGVLYLPANTRGKTLERHATPEEVQEKKLKNGRMNGLILANEEVVRGMEKEAAGVYINAKIDASGRLTGALLTAEDFRALHRRIDTILKETGESLHAGRIPAVPLAGESGKDPCARCDYAAVCLREADGPTRPRTELSHGDALALLRAEEENDG